MAKILTYADAAKLPTGERMRYVEVEDFRARHVGHGTVTLSIEPVGRPELGRRRGTLRCARAAVLDLSFMPYFHAAVRETPAMISHLASCHARQGQCEGTICACRCHACVLPPGHAGECSARANEHTWGTLAARDSLTDEPAPPAVAAVITDPDRLAARKIAEARIEVVFEQLDTDEQLALLFRILRARGWSTDRANTVLAKARWNG